MGTALWAAFDVAGLSTNVQTALVAGVGLVLGFTIYKFIKRSGRAM